MTMALETVALHHFGAQASNRGVLWSAIEADLRLILTVTASSENDMGA